MTTADEFKAMGNKALVAKNYSEAIEHYTAAINLDGANHVYYSNRSAAYLSKNDATNALEDAQACIGLNADFAKGYSRKGAALHSLKRYNDSIQAYEEGLTKFPTDKGLLSGIDAAKKAKLGPPPRSGGGMGMGGMPGMGGLFGPDMMAKIAMDPKTRGYMSDPEFMQKIQTLQSDPNQLTNMLSDPRIMEVFQVILGAQGMKMQSGDEFKADQDAKMNTGADEDKDNACEDSGCTDSKCPSSASSSAPTPTPTPTPASTPTPDLSHLTEDQKSALAAKEKGNQLYKTKQFTEALAAYEEAIALDPTNMTFVSNKAAVYFTTKQYDLCIEACETAVEVGSENCAPFEDRAKALTRAAKAYQKKGDLGKAIELCQKSLLENHDNATKRLMKTMELDKKKKDKAAYLDDDKAEEAKQEGNKFFREKDFGKAVNCYEEAVKRAPKNATIRNNLAAALCKVMDFNGAKREIETAIDLDDKYVKAWARKGDIEVVMKENHKAMESYKKGLTLDPSNATCREGLRKVTAMVNAGSANMSEEEKKERAAHAMADPEIQAILSDPMVNQVLRDFNENPNAANQAMADPIMRAKIEKLIAGGILQTA